MSAKSAAGKNTLHSKRVQALILGSLSKAFSSKGSKADLADLRRKALGVKQ